MKPEVAKWMADLDMHAREKFGLPDGWRVYICSHVPDYLPKTTHFELTGRVVHRRFTKGQWAGHWDFKSGDKSTDRKVHISYAEHDAWVAKRDGKDASNA